MPLVDYYTYKIEDFACRHCGWQGKGAELMKGDFHEDSYIGDLDCPKCFEMVAFWQAGSEPPSHTSNNTHE